MADPPVFYILPQSHLEPASSATSWLGRIVSSYRDPAASFTPVHPSRLLQGQATETVLKNASSILRGSSNSTLVAKLTGIASASSAKDRGSGISFETSEIRCLRLQNHPKLFEKLCADDEVKNDLSRWLSPGGKPAYMIVALLIWTDASFISSRAKSDSSGGSVSVAVSTIVGATTGVILPGDMGNPEISRSVGTTQERRVTAFSEGSHIFAFQYRTVRRRAYSIFSDFTPRLGKGPRVKGDQVFSDKDKEVKEVDDEEREMVPMQVEIDEGHVSWVDVVDDEPDIEDLGNLSFAFH